MSRHPLKPEEIVRCATALIGSPPASLALIRHGRNNKIFRCETSSGIFAVKCYARDVGRSGKRLDAEYAALELLSEHRFENVPTPVGRDDDAQLAVYTWLDGTPPVSTMVSDVDVAVDFLAAIDAIDPVMRRLARLPYASDAIVSREDAYAQMARRRVTFERVRNTAGLGALLDRWDRVADEVRLYVDSRAVLGGQWTDRPVPGDCLILSPSDFGFHNSLRQAEGGLVFVDFEYFGWDDPAKLLCDVLWHPGMVLSDAQKVRFVDRFKKGLRPNDAAFNDRVEVLYPIAAMCWALIALNGFLPGRKVLPDALGVAARIMHQVSKKIGIE